MATPDSITDPDEKALYKNRRHIQRLFEKAQEYVDYDAGRCRVKYLYRNKPEEYFQEILENGHGIMRPYLKDGGGDPRNPINGRVKGLHFCASQSIPPFSPYGEKRIYIPVGELFEADCNLYFADFFCLDLFKPRNNNHYVMLVLTKEDSPADEFCGRNLKKLDPEDNPFLCRSFMPEKEKYYFYIPRKFGCDDNIKPHQFWVEVLHTEDINIKKLLNESRAEMENCEVIGAGSSKSNGIPKNSQCRICNYRKKNINPN